MKLSKKVKILAALQVSLLLMLPFFISRIFNAQADLALSNKVQLESYLLADELRQSSDDLTRMARGYVITGDPSFKHTYIHILEIRNGVKPRPYGYERISWDIYDDQTVMRKNAHPNVGSIRSRMVNLGFSTEEFKKLDSANAQSDALVHLEEKAMGIRKQLGMNTSNLSATDRLKIYSATQMLFDENYHRLKRQIMLPIDEFYEMFNQRTKKATSENSEIASFNLQMSLGILAIIFIVFLLSIRDLLGQIRKNQKFETTLIESERMHRALFDRSNFALAIINPNDLKPKAANPVCLNLLGYETQSEIQSRTLLEHSAETNFANQHYPTYLIQMLKHAILNGQHTFDWNFKKKDESILSTRLTLEAIEHDSGMAIKVTIVDLSEIKELEATKVKMQAQLLHAEKLASLGTLSAGVAHEINNPLAIIQGLASLVESKWNNESEKQKNLERITRVQKATLRITEIVKSLLRYSRQDQDVHSQVDLNICVKESLSLLSGILKNENIKTETSLHSETLLVDGNFGKIQQVIMNLLTNAKDALKGNVGTISISSERLNNLIQLRISDNGSGIPPENLAKIFDPFFTTKEVGVGTGLGLPIGSSIVTSMNGRMELKSEIGKGTEFRIYLHASKAENIAEEDHRFDAEDFKIEGNALVVDDEIDIRNIVSEYLCTMGMTVTQAENGNDAYSKIVSQRFDYLFLDLKMPIMGGTELLKHLDSSQLNNRPIIIVVSGCSQSAFDELNPSYEVVPKPISKLDLAESINRSKKSAKLKLAI